MYSDVAIVILAAGQSHRLGRPKQLEICKGKTLINHAIDVALKVGADQVITVLGANMEKIKSHIIDKNTTIVENQNWAMGMSTSIVCGIEFIEQNHPNIQKIIFLVCDQPYVSKALLQALITTNLSTQKPIIASEYLGIKGTPALFDKSMFGKLKVLTGDVGAGKIIKQHNEWVETVPFAKGEVDIDREEDVVKLNQQPI